ncbi:coiled-coil domain-containing glutamate-rich protein 1 [Discoglossus pictus]
MLRRGGLVMCGRGVLCPWEPRVGGPEPKGQDRFKPRWQRRGVGRYQRGQHRQTPYSLRPVNMMGSRAPGMRAPRNTNQFLMSEKYQMLKLRSDSVGTECSGGSDSEMDPLDMDSYLGVLENAHGALLEHHDPEPCCSSSSSPLSPSTPLCWSPFRVGGDIRPQGRSDKLTTPTAASALFRGGGAILELRGELSEQYYPSEDDVLESENFMERDFQEFCSRII